MPQNIKGPLIDFSGHIQERTQEFTARGWVFQAVNDWLVSPDASRVFLLTGEPGSGKTAIAGQLSRYSQGLPTPDGLRALTPGFLSAIHFCSAGDIRWIDPLVFAGSLATQLANRYPTYLEALQAVRNDRRVQIDVKQNVKAVVNGQVVGVVINVNAAAPESAFNCAVREPLEVLLRKEESARVVILVDALDEALGYSEKPNIISLLTRARHLPPHARFIVTCRPDLEALRPLRRYGVVEVSLTSESRLAQSLDDVEQYVLDALATRPHVVDRLVDGWPPASFAKAVREKSGGNFLYVKYLLAMLADKKDSINIQSLDKLPDKLDEIYLEFLDRLPGLEHTRDTWAEH